MSMYEIPPLVPSDLDIKPLDVMYFIPSYHDVSDKKESLGLCNGPCDDSYNPVKEAEKKQHALLQSLMMLESTLNNLLTELKKSEAPNNEEMSSTSVPKLSTAPVSKSGGKKDKDAKKEARKAARVEAKSKEEKRSNETGQCLTANLPPVLCDYERQKLGEVSLIVTPADEQWVNALSHLGEKRAVVFKGLVCNTCKDASTTINVSRGDSFSVVASVFSYKCRVSAWKLLGCALGIFSYASNHSIQAAHQHRWLSQVDLVLTDKIAKDVVIREASRFLSQFDALSSQFDFGIADIVAKSVLIGSCDTHLPNNVELWSKRLGSAL